MEHYEHLNWFIQGLISLLAFGLTLYIIKAWLNKVQFDAKEATDKIERKLDILDLQLRAEHDLWDGRKEQLIGIYDRACVDHRTACGALVAARLETVCKKINGLKEDRNKQWVEHKELHKTKGPS